MTKFIPNFPGAIVVEAAKYGYPKGARNNNPRAWCLHTPEEPADDNPSTPYYFHNLTDRNASTHYFVAWTGLVFQMVPEDEGAYANGVEGKPYPSWANSSVSLNLQTLNVEIEGYASNIHITMPRGSPQWVSLIRLIAHRCKEKNIPPERTFGHYVVSQFRSDPGQLNINAIIEDVKLLLGGEDMGAYDKAILDSIATLKDGEFVGDGFAIYYVERKGDVPVLKRLDDSRANMITTWRQVPLGVSMLLFHGEQIA